MLDGERTCYIHVGTHKTGTTSIQRFLGANRERFAASGVFFPTAGSDRWLGDTSHHQLAHDLNGDSRFRPDLGGLNAVADELRTSDARVACLSSEDLSFLWNNRTSLERLRDAIVSTGFTPRIVIYLRPQASYCTAVYAETLRHGYRTPFAVYLNDVLTRGHYIWKGGSGPPFDYRKLIDAFAAVFGSTAIIARRYISNAADNALLFAFAGLLLPPQTDFRDFAVPAVRENGSLDFGSVLSLLGGQQALGERIRFSPLSVVDTLRFGQRFGASNAEIGRLYGVALPAFERLDLALAFPFRRTLGKIQALAQARRALGQIGTVEA